MSIECLFEPTANFAFIDDNADLRLFIAALKNQANAAPRGHPGQLHHTEVINITGYSYRLRDQAKKAELKKNSPKKLPDEILLARRRRIEA